MEFSSQVSCHWSPVSPGNGPVLALLPHSVSGWGCLTGKACPRHRGSRRYQSSAAGTWLKCQCSDCLLADHVARTIEDPPSILTCPLWGSFSVGLWEAASFSVIMEEVESHCVYKVMSCCNDRNVVTNVLTSDGLDDSGKYFIQDALQMSMR